MLHATVMCSVLYIKANISAKNTPVQCFSSRPQGLGKIEMFRMKECGGHLKGAVSPQHRGRYYQIKHVGN